MRVFNFLAVCFPLLICSACHRQAQRHDDVESKNDSIVVFYYHGWSESPIRRSCMSLWEDSDESEIREVVYCDNQEFDSLLSVLRNARGVEGEDFDCYLLVVYDSMGIGFCSPDLFAPDKKSVYGCDKHDRRVTVDAAFVYTIKCLSGYYDYWTKEDLDFDKMIRLFGFPRGYKYKYAADKGAREKPIPAKHTSNGITRAIELTEDEVNSLKVRIASKVVIKRKGG